MRELKPLRLPILVASRYSTDNIASLEDVTSARADLKKSASQTSLNMPLSSTPPTPSSAFRGHSRFPSSQSSIGSTTSPIAEVPEFTASTSKLPQLTEEPEADEDMLTAPIPEPSALFPPYKFPLTCLPTDTIPANKAFDASVYDYRSTIVRHDAFDDWEVGNECFFEYPVHSRQKSGDSPLSTVVHSAPRKMPSFSSSMGARHRKQDSKMSNSGLYIQTPSTQASSTRTSSMTSSVFDSVDLPEHLRKFSASSISYPGSPVETTVRMPQEPFDREKLASTPLLPPLVTENEYEQTKVISPYQSPRMATTPAVLSLRNSPNTTPQLGGVSPRMLSTQASMTSLNQPRSIPLGLQNGEILPFFFTDPNDKWAQELGHANFVIEPQPYLPVEFNRTTKSKLTNDYEQAKYSYFRHHMRTIEHYGQNSKTFKLTEQKWADIDGQWRSNLDIVTKRVNLADGSPRASPVLRSAKSLSIITQLPVQSKFPDLGDAGIVGPMIQVAARDASMEPSPTSPRAKDRSFFRLFSGLGRSRKQ